MKQVNQVKRVNHMKQVKQLRQTNDVKQVNLAKYVKILSAHFSSQMVKDGQGADYNFWGGNYPPERRSDFSKGAFSGYRAMTHGP